MKNIWGDGESIEVKSTESGGILEGQRTGSILDMLNLRCLLQIEILTWSMINRLRTGM